MSIFLDVGYFFCLHHRFQKKLCIPALRMMSLPREWSPILCGDYRPVMFSFPHWLSGSWNRQTGIKSMILRLSQGPRPFHWGYLLWLPLQLLSPAGKVQKFVIYSAFPVAGAGLQMLLLGEKSISFLNPLNEKVE